MSLTRSIIVDLIGVILLLLLLGWSSFVADTVGGHAEPLRDLLLLSAAIYAAGRLISAHDARLVPAAVAVTACVVALVRADTLLASPLGSPLGYANATAAFYALAAGASVLYAAREPHVLHARLGYGAAVSLATVPWLIGSQAGAIATLMVGMGLVVALAGGRTARRWTVIAGAVAVAVAFLGTVVMGILCTPSACRVPGALVAALSRNRPRLWHEATTIIGEAPLWGVGPGGFARVAPTAADPDLVWAHGELLELGVELGLPGLLLSTALVLWMYLRLWVSPLGRGVPIVAGTLTGLLLQAQIDYVLHSPVVVITAVVLLAAGVTPSQAGPSPAPRGLHDATVADLIRRTADTTTRSVIRNDVAFRLSSAGWTMPGKQAQ